MPAAVTFSNLLYSIMTVYCTRPAQLTESARPCVCVSCLCSLQVHYGLQWDWSDGVCSGGLKSADAWCCWKDALRDGKSLDAVDCNLLLADADGGYGWITLHLHENVHQSLSSWTWKQLPWV